MNKIIGITGGMSSGKTTLCNLILKANPKYIYIDVDTYRRKLYKNSKYIEELKSGIKELKKYNFIDSKILNKYIYNNKDNMNFYKKTLYKYLFNYVNSLEGTIIVEWALILNDRLEDNFDKIIYIDTNINERLKRLENSDLTKEEILKRFKLQEIKDFKIYKKSILKVDGTSTYDIDKIIKYINSLECKFTLPNNEAKAIWEITHMCNYGCSYCIFSCSNKKKYNELSKEECFHVIDELYKKGFRHLKITGGEPFIRKDIVEILKYASTKMITDISTNASLLTKEIIDKLNEIDLKMIHVSLDGDKFQHESVRGKNTFDKTIKGLELLKNSKNKVRIGSVIHKNNENNLDKLIDISSKYNASEIILSIMEPIKGQDKSLVKTKTNEELLDNIDKLKEKYKTKIIVSTNFSSSSCIVNKCPAGEKFIFINNEGYVSPCTWVYENNKKFISDKSLRNNTLEEVLDSKNLKEFLNSKKENVCYGKIQ